MYQDPERVAMRREQMALSKAKACGDCIYKQSIEIEGEMYHTCKFKNRVYGTPNCNLKQRKSQ
jgi:hypothetical protein